MVFCPVPFHWGLTYGHLYGKFSHPSVQFDGFPPSLATFDFSLLFQRLLLRLCACTRRRFRDVATATSWTDVIAMFARPGLCEPLLDSVSRCWTLLWIIRSLVTVVVFGRPTYMVRQTHSKSRTLTSFDTWRLANSKIAKMKNTVCTLKSPFFLTMTSYER